MIRQARRARPLATWRPDKTSPENRRKDFNDVEHQCSDRARPITNPAAVHEQDPNVPFPEDD
jgi:hypothetical protein